MARILIVGGGCRGRELAAGLIEEGHAVRITTRSEVGRAAIEEVGAECWVGTPDRLATLRGALEGVTVLCWLLASASGPEEALEALHGPRLRFFLTQAIDTTVRGVVYESGTEPDGPAAAGVGAAREIVERNAIPAAFLRADPSERAGWLEQAREAVSSLISAP